MNLTEKILTKTFYFAAAHKLPDYDGPCKKFTWP
jgi:6-pyruvoyl-tetrahydropterin synthase